jgi:hypothetical protein
MTAKTFTRKTNAIKAAERELSKLVESKSLGFELFTTGVAAEDIGLGMDDHAWVAGIYLDRHTKAETDQVAAALPDFKIINETPKEEAPVEAETAEKTETTKRRGRAPSLAGRKLFPSAKLADEDGNIVNPRREGTHGHKSMAVIIDNPGITVEDFVSKGGRLVDLRWDIDRDRVDAKL